ncbi:3,4-dihydroxy-2-butanone-4-phosphate synthase, partial [Nodularia sphaerocarpa]
MSKPKPTGQSDSTPLNGEDTRTGVTPTVGEKTDHADSSTPAFKFDSIDAALADLKAGRVIVVVDDENRENEGDLICAAQFATPSMINFMAVEARGLICLAMTGDR